MEPHPAVPAPKTVEPTAQQYLTPDELSARWRNSVTTRTLANWRVKRYGPAWLKVGGRIVYPLPAVLAWETTKLVVTQ